MAVDARSAWLDPPRMTWKGLFGVCAAVLLAACGSKVETSTTGSGGTGGDGGTAGDGGAGGDGGVATTSGSFNSTINTTSTGEGGGPSPCNPGPPNVDDDADGYTELEGDCNDCDPGMNPGAVEVVLTEPDADGKIPRPMDEDCDGVIDEPDDLCDDGLALDDDDPLSGAKALDLCKTSTGVTWGVQKAAYVRANGGGDPHPLQWGIKPQFGPNVNPQRGQRLLVLSTGRARAAEDPGACAATTCNPTGSGTPPPGFPQDVPGCNVNTGIADDVALELEIRAPTNATGFSFDHKFYSFEFPTWVCTPFNDQFVALVSPAPPGSINGNIAFDPAGYPIGVNAGFMEVCDPQSASSWATFCDGGTCPPLPNPYCPLGSADLVGTGFQEWSPGEAGGATPWLRTTAPVTPGTVLTVRLTVWDTGDQSYDSTVLFDHWQWITNMAAAPVDTAPVPDPL